MLKSKYPLYRNATNTTQVSIVLMICRSNSWKRRFHFCIHHENMFFCIYRQSQKLGSLLSGIKSNKFLYTLSFTGYLYLRSYSTLRPWSLSILDLLQFGYGTTAVSDDWTKRVRCEKNTTSFEVWNMSPFQRAVRYRVTKKALLKGQPTKSTRRDSREMQISRTSIHRMLHSLELPWK